MIWKEKMVLAPFFTLPGKVETNTYPKRFHTTCQEERKIITFRLKSLHPCIVRPIRRKRVLHAPSRPVHVFAKGGNVRIVERLSFKKCRYVHFSELCFWKYRVVIAKMHTDSQAYCSSAKKVFFPLTVSVGVVDTGFAHSRIRNAKRRDVSRGEVHENI